MLWLTAGATNFISEREGDDRAAFAHQVERAANMYHNEPVMMKEKVERKDEGSEIPVLQKNNSDLVHGMYPMIRSVAARLSSS